MAFEITNTLVDNESKIRYDVETLARIELSDVDYLLEIIDKDDCQQRTRRIHLETIVCKLSSVYQLAMDAYKYLGLSVKIDLNTRFESDSSIGLIKKYRDELFHNGIHFLDKTIMYPFGTIEGRGFKGIHVKKGAIFDIKNIWTFSSNSKEFVLTSEGVFEIENPEKENENWILIENFPSITVTENVEIRKIINDALEDLKILWGKISEKIRKGDGTHSYTFLNENGKWDLIINNNKILTKISAEKKQLVITGKMTITPPTQINFTNSHVEFES